MQLFQSLQKLYHATGIYPSQPHRNCSINWKILFILLSQIQFAILTGAYFLIEANSIDEYGASFYGSISAFVGTVFFLINFSKMNKILRLIGKLQEFITKSKDFFTIIDSKINDFNLKKNPKYSNRKAKSNGKEEFVYQIQ